MKWLEPFGWCPQLDLIPSAFAMSILYTFHVKNMFTQITWLNYRPPMHIYNTAVNQVEIPFYQFSQLRCLKTNEIILHQSSALIYNQLSSFHSQLPSFITSFPASWPASQLHNLTSTRDRREIAPCGCPGLPKFCILGGPAMEDALACLEVRTASWQIFPQSVTAVLCNNWNSFCQFVRFFWAKRPATLARFEGFVGCQVLAWFFSVINAY